MNGSVVEVGRRTWLQVMKNMSLACGIAPSPPNAKFSCGAERRQLQFDVREFTVVQPENHGVGCDVEAKALRSRFFESPAKYVDVVFREST